LKSYSFKLGIYDGDKEVYQGELSYEEMTAVISSCPDSPFNQTLYEFAASHPSSTVREYVASKDNLSNKAVEILSADKSINVLRTLVRSSSFKKFASDKLLIDLINLDFEIARNIADYHEQFEMADSAKLIVALLEATDPAILTSLAGNYSTPKKAIKELANNSDPYVANTAKNRLMG
jgi:hypothetical protein